MENEKEKKVAVSIETRDIKSENKDVLTGDKKDKKQPFQGGKIADDFLPENFNPFLRPTRKNQNQNFKKDDFEERIINIKRVIKVTKGGRRFKFSALVVVGNRKGDVGFAIAKHIEVPEAIRKASRLARKNLFKIKIVGKEDTISHEIIGHHGAAKVLLKPATEGKGIVASDIVRSIVELAGIRNIYSKNLGTNNPQNVILATLDGLNHLRTKEEIIKLHEKTEYKPYVRQNNRKFYNNPNRTSNPRFQNPKDQISQVTKAPKVEEEK